MKTWTALQRCALHIYALLLVQIVTSFCAYGILVFFTVFLYKFMLFEFRVKDAAGSVDHMQMRRKHAGAVGLSIA